MARNNSMSSAISAARPSRVLVADPYPVIVQGLRKILEDDSCLQVVAEASTMRSCESKVLTMHPEIAVVDWGMASLNLPATAAFLESDRHKTSIIFLTVTENTPQKREMLDLGASAFVSKWSSARKLRTVLLKARDQRRPLTPHADAAALADGSACPSAAAGQRIGKLTVRERQLLLLVCRGLRNKEIGLQLGIAESTVWHHLTSIFSKLQVGDRLGLTAFAYTHGLIVPEGPGKRRTGADIRVPLMPGAVESPKASPKKYPPASSTRGEAAERTLNA
jgi:DNA-binding NarL/FixJ family response regulator